MALKHLPTEQDLLYEDGVPLENGAHGFLSWDDLVLPLRAYLKRIGFRAFVCSNSPVAYQRGVDALGPDVYVVNGADDRIREGWVPWKEGGLTPTLIVEMLSPSTEARDRGEKKRIYQDIFKTPDYFLFDSDTGGTEAYRLKNGVYVRVHSDRHGRFRCASLPLSLGVVNRRLRWFEKRGQMLPEYGELAECAAAANQRADKATRRADEATQRADKAEAELRLLREELRGLRD